MSGRKYTYAVEVEHAGKWVAIITDRRDFCLGFFHARREGATPRLAYRVTRSDGSGGGPWVIDSFAAVEIAGIGMCAGFPAAEQYERAGNEALARAAAIRERDAARRERAKR